MSRGFLRLTTILVRPILPFLAPLDGAVWRVMNYDVEREEQPIVKIPALLPWAFRAAPLPSKTGPGSLLIALGAVEKDGQDIGVAHNIATRR